MSAGSTHLSDDIIDWYSELASDYCMNGCKCSGRRKNELVIYVTYNYIKSLTTQELAVCMCFGG